MSKKAYDKIAGALQEVLDALRGENATTEGQRSSAMEARWEAYLSWRAKHFGSAPLAKSPDTSDT